MGFKVVDQFGICAYEQIDIVHSQNELEARIGFASIGISSRNIRLESD